MEKVKVSLVKTKDPYRGVRKAIELLGLEKMGYQGVPHPAETQYLFPRSS